MQGFHPWSTTAHCLSRNKSMAYLLSDGKPVGVKSTLLRQPGDWESHSGWFAAETFLADTQRDYPNFY